MRTRRSSLPYAIGLLLLTGVMAASFIVSDSVTQAAEVDKRVKEAEAKRVAVIKKIEPTVVAIFSRGGQGGGSGVLISKEGYALTNFHVVQGSGPVMQCGLADGHMYEAVLVGLDKVGDVALIKLLPPEKDPKKEFPFAPMGDSDKVKVGDWSLAMGNPFLLATDFTPTVTFGLVSGVHRYQYPAGTLLEYTDCIQIDTSINPGNSGGPLYNIDGEIIGINGRGSFEKRGRVNSGVGYAISINQIKNFLGHMYAGIDTDHATLGAVVRSDSEEGANERMVVTDVLDEADALRRGLKVGDELVSFADRPMTTVNQYKNVLGLYPRGWRMPVVLRRDNDKKEILVRLMGVQAMEINDPDKPPDKPPPGKPPVKPIPIPDGPAKKMYDPKPGYANFHFNKMERDRLIDAFKKHGEFTKFGGEWVIESEAERGGKKSDAKVVIAEGKGADGKPGNTTVVLDLAGLKYELEPLKTGADAKDLRAPTGSGGLLMAMYHYRRLLNQLNKGFEATFAHGGHEPFYPIPADGSKPKVLRDLRVDCEVLRTEHGAVPVKWYFSRKDHTLLGFELSIDSDQDPCEVYFYDYKAVDGRQLPHRIIVKHGDERFVTFNVKSYKMN